MSIVSTYWSALNGFRLRSAVTVCLVAISGFLEGLALVTLIPVLNTLSGSPSSVSSGIIDRLFSTLHPSAEEALFLGLALFVALGLGSAFFRFFSDSALLKLRSEIEESARVQMSTALLEMSWPHFISLRLGDLTKAIVSEGFQINMGCNAFLDAVGSLLVVLVLFALSFSISTDLTLFTVLFGAIGALLYRLFSGRSRRHASKLSAMQSQIGDKVGEIFGNLKFFRATGSSERGAVQSREIFRDYAHTYFWTHEYSVLMRLFLEAGAVIFVVSFILMNQYYFHASIASMLIFLSLFYRLAPRLLRMQESLFLARSYSSWFHTWRRRMDSALTHREPLAGSLAPAFEDALEFKGVTYQYPEARVPAVKDVNVFVGRGECVAIVGASGSGKSTMLDLILGLLIPSKGRVTVDSVPLQALQLEAWRARIGLVTQESPVFYGTILHNIAWGEHTPDRAKAEAVARLAHAWEFIQVLPEGLDTIVGERGGKLSGGQRQRLAIARALYRDPLLLVLDEATSALDGESEHHVQQALNNLRGRYTTLLVAHRLKSVQMADRILVLEHGELIEEGSWNELRVQNGSNFSRMASLQGL